MTVAGVEIGYNSPVYLIAELSCNHNNHLPTAVKLIEAAAEAAKDLPGYRGRGQAPREPHHTVEGLRQVGLAGYWWLV